MTTECCARELKKLDCNFAQLGIDTMNLYSLWLQEQQYRITGTSGYELFTYVSNKNPDWKRKIQAFIEPKSFKSQFTEYGKSREKEARKMLEVILKCDIVETRLVVSQDNPWLGFSPDGLIFQDSKPEILIEIKCSFKGKTETISTAIMQEFKKCLDINENEISLKKKHKYYGQVQLGMAIFNVDKFFLVMYAAFDTSFRIIVVAVDREFIIKLLSLIKAVYYNKIIHEVYMRNKENSQAMTSQAEPENII